MHALRERIAAQLSIEFAKSGQSVALSHPGHLSFLLQVVPVSKSCKVPQICLPLQPQRLGVQLPFNLSSLRPLAKMDLVTKSHLVTGDFMPGLLLDLDLVPFAQHTLCSIAALTTHVDHRASGLLGYTADNGLVSRLKEEKIIVEYSSPNIAKPFHAGHLRSTVIGNFVANVLSRLGHEVIRMSYFGDWGTQFGAVLLGFSKYGSAEALAAQPLEHLLSVYTRISKEMEESELTREEAKRCFASLQNGDVVLRQLWSRFCEVSIAAYRALYQRLGIAFDLVEWESMYSLESLKLVEDLLRKGIAYRSDDGTVRVDIGSDGSGVSQYVPIMKSDATSLYLTRDVAAALSRKDRLKFDRMYYVVENAQHAHFEALRQVLLKMDHPWANSLVHVKFGRVNGMSSRNGSGVLLEDILDEAKLRLIESMKSTATTKATDLNATADVLAPSCLIIHDFKSRRQLGYDFKWDEVLQLKGTSGLHLQYAHARLCSLELNCEVQLTPNCSLDCLTEPEAVHLICHIARYDEILYHASRELEPYIVVRYLFQLSHFANGALKVLTVKGQAPEISEARLLLFHCSRKVLADGLRLLGIQPLEAV